MDEMGEPLKPGKTIGWTWKKERIGKLELEKEQSDRNSKKTLEEEKAEKVRLEKEWNLRMKAEHLKMEEERNQKMSQERMKMAQDRLAMETERYALENERKCIEKARMDMAKDRMHLEQERMRLEVEKSISNEPEHENDAIMHDEEEEKDENRPSRRPSTSGKKRKGDEKGMEKWRTFKKRQKIRFVHPETTQVITSRVVKVDKNMVFVRHEGLVFETTSDALLPATAAARAESQQPALYCEREIGSGPIEVWRLEMYVNMKVDVYCYKSEKWLSSKIVQVVGDSIEIHFIGWNNKYNVWAHRTNGSIRKCQEKIKIDGRPIVEKEEKQDGEAVGKEKTSSGSNPRQKKVKTSAMKTKTVAVKMRKKASKAATKKLKVSAKTASVKARAQPADDPFACLDVKTKTVATEGKKPKMEKPKVKKPKVKSKVSAAKAKAVMKPKVDLLSSSVAPKVKKPKMKKATEKLTASSSKVKTVSLELTMPLADLFASYGVLKTKTVKAKKATEKSKSSAAIVKMIPKVRNQSLVETTKGGIHQDGNEIASGKKLQIKIAKPKPKVKKEGDEQHKEGKEIGYTSSGRVLHAQKQWKVYN